MKTAGWIGVGVALASTMLAARAEAKKWSGSTTYNSDGLKVAPVDDDAIELDDDKLVTKLNFENTTDRFIIVDRNLIEAKTADGKTVKRNSTGGDAYVLAPGKTERIDMVFVV